MPSLDPATRQALEARLRFYRELGLTDFYRRPVAASEAAVADSAGVSAAAGTDAEGTARAVGRSHEDAKLLASS